MTLLICTFQEVLIGWDGQERTEMHTEYFLKSEGNRLLETPGYRWDDNIKMDFKEIGWEVEFIRIADGAVPYTEHYLEF
jgi:hypothetical protein